MENADRENLICFLAKFQGGGEPSKDIFDRYPIGDLKKDIYIPLKQLTKKVEEHLIFDLSEESENAEEMLYPFREDQKVLRIGVRSNEEDSFDWLYELRSSCLIELTDKGIDSILQFLSDRKTCVFCYCEWIDGLDHGGQGDHYFLREYPNDRVGRTQLRMMILCLLANLESGEDTEA